MILKSAPSLVLNQAVQCLDHSVVSHKQRFARVQHWYTRKTPCMLLSSELVFNVRILILYKPLAALLLFDNKNRYHGHEVSHGQASWQTCTASITSSWFMTYQDGMQLGCSLTTHHNDDPCSAELDEHLTLCFDGCLLQRVGLSTTCRAQLLESRTTSSPTLVFMQPD